MLMSFKDGRISVFDTSALFTAGSDDIDPLHTWPPSPYTPRQILPNPGDMANIVAVLLEPGAAQSVVVLDVQKHESLAGWERDDQTDPIITSMLRELLFHSRIDVNSIVVSEREAARDWS
jgi:nucleoporin NUP159